MKRIIKSLSFTAAIALFAVSCAPDDSNTTTTPTPTDPKQKWIATWNVTETSNQNGTSSFQVHINDSTGSSYVIIENMYNAGFPYKIECPVSSSSLTINNQPLTSGLNISGSGTMVNNNQINMSYYVDQGGGSVDTCTAVLTK